MTALRHGQPGHDRPGGGGRDTKGVRPSGLIAWLIWLFVCLWYLIGCQNRLLVFIQWSASFVTHGRAARLITEPAASAARGDQGVA